MTEERIKEIVRKYIMNCFLSDNADCLHELDDWYVSIDDDPGELLKGVRSF